MSEIRVKENESLESALRRFKRKTARDGILAEARKREHYEKPSVKRKKKAEAARKRKYSVLQAGPPALPSRLRSGIGLLRGSAFAAHTADSRFAILSEKYAAPFSPSTVGALFPLPVICRHASA